MSPSFSANCRKDAARPASSGTQASDSIVVPSKPSHWMRLWRAAGKRPSSSVQWKAPVKPSCEQDCGSDGRQTETAPAEHHGPLPQMFLVGGQPADEIPADGLGAQQRQRRLGQLAADQIAAEPSAKA